MASGWWTGGGSGGAASGGRWFEGKESMRGDRWKWNRSPGGQAIRDAGSDSDDVVLQAAAEVMIPDTATAGPVAKAGAWLLTEARLQNPALLPLPRLRGGEPSAADPPSYAAVEPSE